jgi:hypothetical protein
MNELLKTEFLDSEQGTECRFDKMPKRAQEIALGYILDVIGGGAINKKQRTDRIT